MKVFILTEGGEKIGFGHLTRCISLYEALEERGITPKFVVNRDESIEDLLKNKNYEVLNWIEERNKIFRLIKDADVTIIDSYLADISFYKNLSNIVKVPVYMDDGKRLNYPRGVVVNGSIYAKKLDYPKRDGIVYLLGPKYTPLRKEFWEVPRRKIKEELGSIMITFGGDDTKNMTPKILRFLKENYPNLKKNVIIGEAFQNIDQIKKEADENTDLIYYSDAEKMKEIMLESDIAISAGGQTLYELAKVGVPPIGICIADDQLLNLVNWKKKRFTEYIGWHKDKKLLFELEKSINKLIPYKERIKRSERGRSLVDGKGAKRVAGSI